MTIKVVNLTEDKEEAFWKHVNQDPLEYFFFIYDWKHFRKITEIKLALEDDKIEGMMIIFRKSIVQFRGSRQAVKPLLDHLDLRKVELVAPKECRDLVLKKFKPSKEYEISMLHMKKGEEKTLKHHETVELSTENAEEIADLMRTTFPDWWGETTAERITSSMRNHFWRGIERDGKIVSIGNTLFVDIGSNIGVVATDEAHRNKGYATSVVSALVDEIFKRHETALIHVLSTNGTAIHVYEKVGFKPYNSYFLIRERD